MSSRESEGYEPHLDTYQAKLTFSAALHSMGLLTSWSLSRNYCADEPRRSIEIVGADAGQPHGTFNPGPPSLSRPMTSLESENTAR